MVNQKKLKNIIIAANVAGAGKSTMAKYLVSKYKYHEITFAAPIKMIAKAIFDMNEKDRYLLQQIGQKMREIDPDVWVKYVERQLPNFNLIVISDARQENELEMAIQHNFIPVRVVCNRNEAIRRLIKRDGYCDTTKLDGPAEDGIRKEKMPQIYNNASFKEFYKEIDSFIQSISI